jgi:hypothetical protein
MREARTENSTPVDESNCTLHTVTGLLGRAGQSKALDLGKGMRRLVKKWNLDIFQLFAFVPVRAGSLNWSVDWDLFVK